MQIYGILLNIRGILLNIRGILLKNRENQRISEKIREYLRKSFLFIPNHSFSFFIFKLYYYFCTGIYSINCSYEENYSIFSHHFYGYWR